MRVGLSCRFAGVQAVVERGDFGSEINEHILASLINDLKANELYVQLSVADPITHPLLEAVTPHIPALKAARMFKRSLEDDPSLPGVGLAAVAYSTFNDLQYGEPVGATQNAPYDPDLHLLIHVPQEQFRGSSQFHALFMAAITVQPLAYTEPKHVGPERVQVMGFARKIPGSRPMRMGKFGNGLPYSEQILIDQLIAKHNFIVHVLITGLRRETERREAEATAEEIYKRFKIRTRGTFDVVFIEPVKPQEVRSSPFVGFCFCVCCQFRGCALRLGDTGLSGGGGARNSRGLSRVGVGRGRRKHCPFLRGPDRLPRGAVASASSLVDVLFLQPPRPLFKGSRRRRGRPPRRREKRIRQLHRRRDLPRRARLSQSHKLVSRKRRNCSLLPALRALLKRRSGYRTPRRAEHAFARHLQQRKLPDEKQSALGPPRGGDAGQHRLCLGH